MVSEAVACPLDLKDHGVMEQAIQQSGCHDGITEDIAPFSEAPVRRQDHRAFFITRIHQLEEEICPA